MPKNFAVIGLGGCIAPRHLRAIRETLALPLYPELTPGQQDMVIEGVREFSA